MIGRTLRHAAISASLLGLLALGAQAEPPTTTSAPAPDADAPVAWVRVTADRLNVRSEPDLNSLVVARVHEGTLLKSVRQTFGWHAVVPPVGVFSLVHKDYIDRRGNDEGVVSVRSGKLRVRVGSLIQPRAPEQCPVQILLERGTRVKILDVHDDDWLRIAPPDGVHVYVHGDYVEAIPADQARRLIAEATGDVRAAVTTTQPVGGETAGPWARKLQTIENAIAEEAARPILARQWQPLIERLEPIADQREEPLPARVSRAWIEKLERRVAEQTALREAEAILRRSARQRAVYEQEMERIEEMRRAARNQPTFVARGILLRSYAVEDNEQHRWFKLQDPLTRMLEAYVQVDRSRELDLEGYLGRYVGLSGVRRFDPDLGADVVQTHGLTVLRARVPATQPTTPQP